MALGLNVVVGYAGLLDLGYVAFYAAGAYVAGWFASQQFAPHSCTSARRRRRGHAGNPHLALVADPRRRGLRRPARRHDRRADAAAAGRLPRDRHARLRRDHPAGRAQRQQLLRLQRDQRPGGVDGPRPDRLRTQLHGGFSFIPVDFTIQYNPDKFFYWSLVVMLAFTLFCMIRLRDSRLGRAWVAIREDEDAASAMGIPLMRTKTYAYAIGAFFGGGGRVHLRVLQGRDVPERLLAQHLDHRAVHGDPRRDGQRVGRLCRRRPALVPELPGPERGRQHVQRRRRDERQRAAVPVPRLRHDHRRW